jgi:hypothetical protein
MGQLGGDSCSPAPKAYSIGGLDYYPFSIHLILESTFVEAGILQFDVASSVFNGDDVSIDGVARESVDRADVAVVALFVVKFVEELKAKPTIRRRLLKNQLKK